jgi:hypothetical protein
MGFVKFLGASSLSDKDKRALKQVLDRQKRELQAALRDVDQGLAILKKAPKKKKARKAKKGR